MRQQNSEIRAGFRSPTGREEELFSSGRYIGICIADEYAMMVTGSAGSVEYLGRLAFNIGGGSSGLSPNSFHQRFDSRLSLVVHWINATLSATSDSRGCGIYIGATRPLDASFARQIRHDSVRIVKLNRYETVDESLDAFHRKILELQNENRLQNMNPRIA